MTVSFYEIYENLVLHLQTAIISVGWYIVAITIVLCYTFPHLKKKYRSWKLKKDEQEYYSKYHKNPDVFQSRLAEVKASRERMQEKYSREAELVREMEEERKERKRQELLELMEGQSTGNKLGSGDSSTSLSKGAKSKLLKREYNPLMGDTSRGYRAQKRSCCGKGGCG